MHPTYGIIHNVCIPMGYFVHLVDFHIIKISLKSLCPVIFGSRFYNSMSIDIDNEKRALSLQVGKEAIEINYNQFTKLPYEKKVEMDIEELAAIYFTP